MNEEAGQVKSKPGVGRLLLGAVSYIVVLALGGAGGIFFAQQKPELVGLSKSAAAAQAEADSIVAQVGKLISLPTDEKPTVATVTDASKVKDQPFFAKAQNGDKVLIYQKAQKAILYRPSSNMIVEVGAVNINNQAAVQTPAASPTPSGKPVSTPKESPLATPATNQ